jgi:hypothetical protein
MTLTLLPGEGRARDAAGHVYIAWQDWRSGESQIWFSTNNPAGFGDGFRGRDTKQIQPRVNGGTMDRHPISGLFGTYNPLKIPD